MTRVFIIEAPRTPVDLSLAERYGEVTYVFSPDKHRCSVFQVEQYGELILHEFKKTSFDYRVDFVCIVGSMVPVVVAIAALLQAYPTLKLLLYQAKDSIYIERTIGQGVWNAEADKTIDSTVSSGP